MSLLAWIVLGLLAGFIGSKIVNKTGEGIFLDIVLGIVGAVAGGWLFNTFGASGVTGLNLYSLLVAVVGAVVILLAYQAFRRVVEGQTGTQACQSHYRSYRQATARGAAAPHAYRMS